MSLAVDTDDLSGISVLGKDEDDLQSGIEIGENVITGTTKYVTGYTGFSGDPALQSGHYLALHAACGDEEGVTYTFYLTGGIDGPKTLDEDGLMILRMVDPLNQSIVITATKSGKSYTKTWSLRGLTLA